MLNKRVHSKTIGKTHFPTKGNLNEKIKYIVHLLSDKACRLYELNWFLDLGPITISGTLPLRKNKP